MTCCVGIDFACNDPDNGIFAGRIEGIQLYDSDPIFELEPRRSPPPLLTRLEDDAIRISGKRWPIEGSKDWVGNWCWNRYFFTVERAADLLIWLNARGKFDLTTGEHRLYQAWRWHGGLHQFRPFLLTLLGEAARG